MKVGQRVFECPSSSRLPPQYLLAVELSISLVSKCGKFSRGNLSVLSFTTNKHVQGHSAHYCFLKKKKK